MSPCSGSHLKEGLRMSAKQTCFVTLLHDRCLAPGILCREMNDVLRSFRLPKIRDRIKSMTELVVWGSNRYLAPSRLAFSAGSYAFVCAGTAISGLVQECACAIVQLHSSFKWQLLAMLQGHSRLRTFLFASMSGRTS